MTGKFEPGRETSRLEHVVADALRHLEELGYCPGTLRKYRTAWRKLLRFAQASNSRVLSPDLTSRFLVRQGIRPPVNRAKLRGCQVIAQRAVRVLTEFAERGSFRRRMRKLPEADLPEGIAVELSAYERFCEEHLGHSSITIGRRRRVLVQFFEYLRTRDVFTLGDLLPLEVYDFLASLSHLRPRSFATVAGALKSFVRYLCMRGIIEKDGTVEWVPTRVAKDQRLPSVWPRESVENLLAAVDRRTKVGKRDYTILLLSCRLGLRASDIRGLRLDDIHWPEGRIKIVQSKTRQPLTLPLEDDVAEALIDYLQHARPTTDYREVFLKSRAPVEPFRPGNSFSCRVTTYIANAKISLPPGTRRGLHALRHTLATRLLEAGEPLETIAGILGHISVESTRTYTRLDVDALRCVALDPEEVLHG